MRRQVITEAVVRQAARDGRPLQAADDAIFTPSAREAISDFGVEVVRPGSSRSSAPQVPAFRVVGVAADHGGVEVKKWVCAMLEELGMEYRDHGVNSESDTVDYPDKAAEIAKKVQAGTYWRGIVVAGFGRAWCTTP